MDEKERKLMLNIAKQNQFCTDWIKRYESIHGKLESQQSEIPPRNLPIKPNSASNFFGKSNENLEESVLCEIGYKFKKNVPQNRVDEIEKGKMMLSKAVMELCQEFGLSDFNLTYQDHE